MLHKVPILLHGVIENETGLSFQAIVKVFPIERHYEEPNEPPYIKYTCPVCDKIGLSHQVHTCNKQCPNCGVNLSWGITTSRNAAYAHRHESDEIHIYALMWISWSEANLVPRLATAISHRHRPLRGGLPCFRLHARTHCQQKE